jgi:antitoxin VapB
MTEFNEKQKRIQALLAKRKLDALLLARVSSFAWATCGVASNVNTAESIGEAKLLITSQKRYLLTNNIEAARLEREEKLSRQGWQMVVSSWHETEAALAGLTKDMKVGADCPWVCLDDLTPEIVHMRVSLTEAEARRYRALARSCAQAVEAAIRSIRPGQTELRIAARLSQESGKRGILPVVNLTAVDDHIFNERHPLPTNKTLEKYAMVGLCGRKEGLVCSLTRFVHFGRLPATLRRRAEAVSQIDASFIISTRPGRTLGDIFQEGLKTYREVGYPDEWQRHHQGGVTGYEPREILALPGSPETVSGLQAFAWNPTLTGTKSEDTILVTREGSEILTEMDDWPTIPVEINHQTIPRPAVLERGQV